MSAPERAATPADCTCQPLATRSGCPAHGVTAGQRPRTLHALCEQTARLVACEACGARPGQPCTSGPVGYHLARFVTCRHHPLIPLTGAEMDTVLDAAGPVFTARSLILDEGNAR